MSTSGKRAYRRSTGRPTWRTIDRPVRSVKVKIRALTHRTSQWDFASVLTRLGQIMRGWANYFKHAVAKSTFSKLDSFTWWRLVHMLRARHGCGELRVTSPQPRAMGNRGGRDRVLPDRSRDGLRVQLTRVRPRRDQHRPRRRRRQDDRARPQQPALGATPLIPGASVAGSHARGSVEPDRLAVQHGVLDDLHGEPRVLVGRLGTCALSAARWQAPARVNTTCRLGCGAAGLGTDLVRDHRNRPPPASARHPVLGTVVARHRASRARDPREEP